MKNNSLLSSSIGRKILMSLSSILLLLFLIQHLLINLISVFNKDLFNKISLFMGTNIIIQYILQPILFIGVIFHFTMGIYLEIHNNMARGYKGYIIYKGYKNSTWVSRNMIFSGGFILFFLLLHLWQFWLPTIKEHYFEYNSKFYHNNFFISHLNNILSNLVTIILYIISFIFLSLHLRHGFQSCFRSLGLKNNKYLKFIILFGNFYSIFIPLGFIFIAIYHYIKQLN